MELTNGKLRVRLAPEIGGSIIECSVNRAEQWIPIFRKAEEDQVIQCLEFCPYPLFQSAT